MRIQLDIARLEKGDTVPFMRSGVQIYHLIEKITEQTGPVMVCATTFSVAEEFLRSMLRLKKAGTVKRLEIVADLKSAAKTVKINDLLKGVADAVFMAENHSKVVLMFNDEYRIVIITSQNQTRGNRTEAGVIYRDDDVFDFFMKSVDDLKSSSVVWK